MKSILKNIACLTPVFSLNFLRKTSQRFILFILSILIPGAVWAQDWRWIKYDQLINPTGVQSFGYAKIDLGDIDGDSWLDLVVNDSTGIRMYRNLGLTPGFRFERRLDWEFGAELKLEGKRIPTLADLNGDGRADFILPDAQTNSFRFWLNTGHNSNIFWTPEDSVIATISGNKFLSVADFDNDDDLDVVTYQEHNLTLYWNKGNSVTPKWELASDMTIPDFYEGQPNHFRFIDVNGDLLPELFAAFDFDWNSGVVLVGRNKSRSDTLIFDFPPRSGTLYDAVWDLTIAVGDIDKDGNIDMLSGQRSPFIYVWNSDFDSTRNSFKQKGILGFPFGYLETALGTVKWESGLQVIFQMHLEPPTDYWPGTFQLIRYFRQNSLWQRDNILTEIFPNEYSLSSPTLDIFDWHKDGVWDLALGANKDRTQTTLFYSTDTWPPPDFFADFSEDSLFHDPMLADINGDGILDLFLQQAQQYSFYENIGTLDTPTWEKRPQWSDGLALQKHHRAEIGDLTKNGLLDIVFGETNGTLSFFRNVGTTDAPQWQQDTTVFEDVELDSLAMPTLVDLDFDDDLDLILGDPLGRFHAFRNDFITSVSSGYSEIENPHKPQILQNYPNPFNGSTVLEFAVSKPQKVTIRVYDLLGREVDVLLNEKLASGFYSKKWTPKNLPSGTYFIQIKAGDFMETRKAVLQK